MMGMKKFTAANIRDALKAVKDTLGEDAVIMSNKHVNGRVEILAVAGENAPIEEKVETPAQKAKAVGRPIMQQSPEARRQNSERFMAQIRAIAKEYLPPDTPTFPTKPAKVSPFPAQRQIQPAIQAPVIPTVQQQVLPPAKNVISTEAVDARLKHVMSELRMMRDMFETQLAEITWGSKQEREPYRADLMRDMLSAGFSPGMARYLIENLPDQEKGDAMRWVQRTLAKNLKTFASEDALLDKGGVFALIGPTGVGKTTTTAKLAARFVMRHGASKLALITTDAYRIGGFEQLRIYGKILGVMVHTVKDQGDLRLALEELKNKHTVLIDTVGMSQRDRMVSEQIAMLSNTGTEVKRLLCLAATSTGETLNEVVSAYKGKGLAGCIMTKIDEAVTIGSVLDVIIRQKLALYYVANGQRVPEDLEVANAVNLIRQAFASKTKTKAYTFDNEELPMVVANSLRSTKEERARGVA